MCIFVFMIVVIGLALSKRFYSRKRKHHSQRECTPVVSPAAEDVCFPAEAANIELDSTCDKQFNEVRKQIALWILAHFYDEAKLTQRQSLNQCSEAINNLRVAVSDWKKEQPDKSQIAEAVLQSALEEFAAKKPEKTPRTVLQILYRAGLIQVDCTSLRPANGDTHNLLATTFFNFFTRSKLKSGEQYDYEELVTAHISAGGKLEINDCFEKPWLAVEDLELPALRWQAAIQLIVPKNVTATQLGESHNHIQKLGSGKLKYKLSPTLQR